MRKKRGRRNVARTVTWRRVTFAARASTNAPRTPPRTPPGHRRGGAGAECPSPSAGAEYPSCLGCAGAECPSCLGCAGAEYPSCLVVRVEFGRVSAGASPRSLRRPRQAHARLLEPGRRASRRPRERSGAFRRRRRRRRAPRRSRVHRRRSRGRRRRGDWYAPRGRHVRLLAPDRRDRLSDASSERVVGLSGEHRGAATMSPDGRTAAYAAGSVVVALDLETRAQTHLFGHSDDVHLVRFSDDGELLVTAQRGRASTVRAWTRSTGRGGASPCCTRERRRFDRSTSPPTARRWPSRGRTRGDDSSSPPGTSVSRASAGRRRRRFDTTPITTAVRSLFALRRRRPLRVRQKFRPRVSPSKGKTQGPERPPRRPRPAKGEGERGGGRDAERRRLVGVLRSGIHDVGVCALDPRRVQTEEDVRGNHHGRGGADRLPRETPRVRVPAARRRGERTVRVGRNRRVGVGRRIRARVWPRTFQIFFSRRNTSPR